MDSLTARSPSLSPSIGSKRSPQFAPLSAHGMPKAPSLLSPNGSLRPHRFSGSTMPSSPRPSEPPLSPMSPPMSAKSFGTFIDSEPSTPAYSPRMGSTWDSSTLVLLSPVSSAPSSPVEPVWQMMTPIQKPPKKRMTRHKPQPSISKEISLNACLSPPANSVHLDSAKENRRPVEENAEQKQEEKPAQAAPLERLATRMKSLLKRKPNPETKAAKKQKNYFELDRMETVHWTEM